jgi:cell division protein FtsB
MPREIMGYGGAPSWVVKNRMQAQVNACNNEIYQLNSRIRELEAENEALKTRINELETKLDNK